ncbi:MAG: MFS transporter [Myxococcota bacterium]
MTNEKRELIKSSDMIAENREAGKQKKLPNQVKALGLVSFFNDAASEMIYPLLPAFVVQTLGLGPHVLGVMEGLAETIASLLKFLSGWWSDKLGKRKPLAVFGYTIASVLRPLMGLASAGWHLVLLRSLDRVGKGIRTAPRDALLAASVTSEIRGRAFGFHRAMDHAGAAVGPLIALALISGMALDLRAVFILTAVPSIVTIFLIVFAVKEAPVVSSALSPTTTEISNGEVAAAQKGNNRSFSVFLISMVLFTLGNSSDVFLVLLAHERGIPSTLAPVLWLVLHLSKTALSTPGGALSDRIGRKYAILLGWLTYALTYLGFAFASAPWHIWTLFVAYGFYYGLTEGAEKAMTADLVPARYRGRGFGLYHLSVGISALPASAAAGYLWKEVGATAALSLGAGFAALAALTLAAGMPHKER